MEAVNPATVSYLEHIAEQVRRTRLAKGWSQKDLTSRAGLVDNHTVINIEAGRSVQLRSLIYVLQALGLRCEVAS